MLRVDLVGCDGRMEMCRDPAGLSWVLIWAYSHVGGLALPRHGEALPLWFHCHPLPVPRVLYSTVNKWPAQLRLPPAHGQGWVERWTKASGSPAPTEPGKGDPGRPTGSK